MFRKICLVNSWFENTNWVQGCRTGRMKTLIFRKPQIMTKCRQLGGFRKTWSYQPGPFKNQIFRALIELVWYKFSSFDVYFCFGWLTQSLSRVFNVILRWFGIQFQCYLTAATKYILNILGTWIGFLSRKCNSMLKQTWLFRLAKILRSLQNTSAK